MKITMFSFIFKAIVYRLRSQHTSRLTLLWHSAGNQLIFQLITSWLSVEYQLIISLVLADYQLIISWASADF